MSDRSNEPRLVVEIERRGKLIFGEPYFTPGVPIVLDAKGFGGLERGDLAIVRLGRGRARVERALGSAKRIENVLEALLVEKGARVDFEPHDVAEPSLDGRIDLRELTTITIDPDTAKDFDDALSFRREPEGIRAWVHIADVSFFVPAGSPLDRGAAARALSTYVPGLVAPMLPHELADDVCSLRPHQDRLCVTVEMPPGGGEPLFYRSVINSNARLTYGQAERGEAPPEILEQLELAAQVAGALRKRRFQRGALQVETPEVAFRFDGGRVADAWLEREPHAHMLVEELMILANEHVAAFLAGRGREALFRVHERPDPQAIGLLLAKLADLKVPTPPVPDVLTPEAAAALAGEISRRIAAYVEQSGRGREAFPALVLRALKQARYDPHNLGHSGLASPAYCHFTSPIRRYPDLVVHRVLLNELGLGDVAIPDDLSDLAEHASVREREAAQIEYLADDLCLAWLLEDRLTERGWEEPWEGEITGIIGSGLFVRFGDVFEGFLPARRLPGEFFEVNPTGTALVGRRSGSRYRLGDPIEVRVESIAKDEGKVELALRGSGPRRPAPRTPTKRTPTKPPAGTARKGRRRKKGG
jgi:ribonuclease R